MKVQNDIFKADIEISTFNQIFYAVVGHNASKETFQEQDMFCIVSKEMEISFNVI